MSEHKPNRLHTYDSPTADTPEALNLEGFDDEEYPDERRSAARAEQVGFGRAVRLFYRHYWNGRGEASPSEFWWALLYLVLGTVLYFGATIWLNRVTLAEDSSSVLRTLFMFLVITNPLWVAVNIGPTITLFKRRANAAYKR
ncbi:DUF805 domain-containing protein [Rothia nasisuis]|uniref:DUF805 domain-containing protein n=1 Tax=Rothia nasisuis TaxID=2109647 RepID=UPI001F3A4CA7|nr:DUF805 domain-containing protein [Rothia nasisuis]